MSELRHAFRSLRRTPWYTVTVVGVTALGIALAATVFAVVDGVLFKPLPYPRASEVFGLSPVVAGKADGPRGLQSASIPDLRAWRAAAPDVTFAAFSTIGMKLTLGGDAVEYAQIDAGFLDVLGQQPLVGGFRPEDFGPRGPVRPVLIGYGLWQRAFAGDPAVVGRSFPEPARAGAPAASNQVVGILPPDFLFPSPAGFFKPEVLMAMAPPSAASTADAVGKSLSVIARVPGDRPIPDVERQLADAAREVAKLYPPYQAARPWVVPYDVIHVVPIRVALTWLTRANFSTTFLMAAALMLLACVNLAGLAGARMQDRQHELALRRALGAGRADLLRLAGIESAVAVFTGAAIGLLVANALLGVVRALMPSYLLLKPLAIDARVMAFCALAAAISVVMITAWPARATRGASLRPSLAGSGTTSGGRSRGRAVLVGAQVALALVLVLMGALFAASLGRVWQQDAGVRTDRAFRIELTTRGMPQDVTTINDLIASVRRVPGVADAGGLEHAFLQQIFNGSPFDAPRGIDDHDIESLPVTAGFLQAAGLAAIEGRLPADQEFEAGAPVLAVSVRAAQRYWPGQPAVGQTLTLRGRPFTVVGVVPDVRYRSLDVEPEGEVYWPLAADAKPMLWNLYVRLQPGAGDAVASILRGLATRFPAYQVLNVQTAAQSYGSGIRQRRFQAWLFGSFGVAALAIVGAGILGLLAMTTARRTREIGIRIALGATRDRIVRLLLREQLVAVAAGVIAGGAVAAWGVRLVQASLYRSTGYDTPVWTAAVAVIVLTAVAGTLLPALRASRTDPMTALRVE